MMTQLTTNEKVEFLDLYTRKLGLYELIRLINIAQNEELYNRILMDIGETTRKYDSQWQLIKKKYNYLTYPDKDLNIDYDNGTVSVIQNPSDPDFKIL